MDRQISFPLSNILHVNGERSSQPLLHDFTEDIQFMDVEDTSGELWSLFRRLKVAGSTAADLRPCVL